MDGQTPGDCKDRSYAQRRVVKTVKRMLYTVLTGDYFHVRCILLACRHHISVSRSATEKTLKCVICAPKFLKFSRKEDSPSPEPTAVRRHPSLSNPLFVFAHSSDPFPELMYPPLTAGAYSARHTPLLEHGVRIVFSLFGAHAVFSCSLYIPRFCVN